MLGWSANSYRCLMARMRVAAPRDALLVLLCMLAFVLTGVISMGFPQIPGNGKGPLQMELLGQMPLHLAVILLVLKLVVTAACLRAGAEGGLLTPGLAVGGLISAALAALGAAGGIDLDVAGCACIGAAAFLGVSMRMPLAAMALMIGFTNLAENCLLPMAVCCAAAWLSAVGLEIKLSWAGISEMSAKNK